MSHTAIHPGCSEAGREGVHLDLRSLRVPGGLMLALAVLLPMLPGHPGLACPLRMLTGIPCPACGMTTSVEAAVRFDLAEAWAANPMGIVAVVVAAAALVARRPLHIRVHVAWAVAVLGAMWVFQLARFGFL